jgi:hypothetical protein
LAIVGLVAGNDASGILSAVLQDSKSVVNCLINGTFGEDTDYSTHAGMSPVAKNLV